MKKAYKLLKSFLKKLVTFILLNGKQSENKNLPVVMVSILKISRDRY